MNRGSEKLFVYRTSYTDLIRTTDSIGTSHNGIRRSPTVDEKQKLTVGEIVGTSVARNINSSNYNMLA